MAVSQKPRKTKEQQVLSREKAREANYQTRVETMSNAIVIGTMGSLTHKGKNVRLEDFYPNTVKNKK